MPPMDSSASTYFHENSWIMGNNCPDLFDVKTEAGGFSNSPLINSISSSGESCMSKVAQVFLQRSAGMSSGPHLSSFDCANPTVSDCLIQDGLDHVNPPKCAFSTVTSAQRVDSCLTELVSGLPMEDQLPGPARFLPKDSWTTATVSSNPSPLFTTGAFGSCLVKPGSFGGASAAMESPAQLQKDSLIMRSNTVKTDDASLDDILTNSSGVSSSSGYNVAREQEDEDGICTSAEPSSKLGKSSSFGLSAGVGAIALTQKDDQQQQPQMSGLTGVGGAIPLTHKDDQQQQQQMPGLTGVGGGASPTMAALNATLNTVAADKSIAALRHNTMADHLAHAMLFRAPFAAMDMAAVENSRPKRRNVKISKDPQSVAARHRRERISDRIRVLQRLVPGGTKMDTASMLDEAIHYVKYLKEQVTALENYSANGFDPRLALGANPMYRNGMAGLPYGTMGIDCSSVSQGMGSVQNDFCEGSLNQFAPIPDGNFPVQFCH